MNQKPLWALIGLALAACSGRPPPAETAASPGTAPAETAAPASGPAADVPAAAPAEGEATPAPAAAEPESLKDACNKMCDAIAPKCSSKDQVATCRLNCSDYTSPQPACEEVTRQALGCITEAPDFLMCSGVVPERCSKKFRARKSCEEKGTAPTTEQEGYPVPKGWAVLSATEPRFKVAMPKEVETKTEAGLKKWLAKGANGATFEVSVQPPPEEKKVDQKVFLKVATKLLGKCSDKMKLHALVEKPDRSVIHYSTKCPDKTERRGLLYVFGGHLFVLSVRWQGTPPPETEAFVYNFSPD